MQIIQHSEDLATATGTMRNYIYRPASEQRYPAIVFYSEIFQHTAPIVADFLKGESFVVQRHVHPKDQINKVVEQEPIVKTSPVLRGQLPVYPKRDH